MKEGTIVKSLKGHDTDRVYVVVAVLNCDFVLVCDGKYRLLSNPKQKRVKHLEIIGSIDTCDNLTDAALRKTCKTN